MRHDDKAKFKMLPRAKGFGFFAAAESVDLVEKDNRKTKKSNKRGCCLKEKEEKEETFLGDFPSLTVDYGLTARFGGSMQ